MYLLVHSVCMLVSVHSLLHHFICVNLHLIIIICCNVLPLSYHLLVHSSEHNAQTFNFRGSFIPIAFPAVATTCAFLLDVVERLENFNVR